MTQTNEELREKLFKIVTDYEPHSDGVANSTVDKIMSLIPQPEQLEVEIQESNIGELEVCLKVKGAGEFLTFPTKQEALDFCKRFNLKVTNEPEGE